MTAALGFFVSVWLKFFFLFTPFFALSMFLTLTDGYSEAQRRRLTVRVAAAVVGLCLALFLFGNVIFRVLSITVDAFRIGAGALLFLSAVDLVRAGPSPAHPRADDDIAVVPLAMPVIVGPATTGTLLVLGAEINDPFLKGLGCLALLVAVVSVSIVLLLASYIQHRVGRRRIGILSKVTGLVLAALASEMIFTGVRAYLR